MIPSALGNMFIKKAKIVNLVTYGNSGWFCIRFDCWGNQSGGGYLLRKAEFSWIFHNDSPSLETLYNSHKNVQESFYYLLNTLNNRLLFISV